MKKTSVLFATALALFALDSSAARLACWDLYSKKGSRPLVTAEIVANDQLTNIKIGTIQTAFGEVVLENPATEAAGKLITTKRSPYFGGQEFDVTGESIGLIFGVRLILPADLSPEALKETVFEAGNLPPKLAARQNGVLDLAGSFTRSGGSTYNRMHCTSK